MNNAIQIERRAGMGYVTLSRGSKRNAFDAEMMDALRVAADELGNDPAVKVVFLAGEGEAFCAGADLSWMEAQMNADRAGKIKEAKRLSDMLAALNEMPKPLVTYGHGAIFGGGLGLLAVSDIVILDANAKLSFSETKLGLIPATIGPFVLQKIGHSAARQLFLSAEIFMADRAVDIGLAHLVGTKVEAQARAEGLLKNSASAMAKAKAVVQARDKDALEAEIELAQQALADIWETEDACDRVGAFLAKGKSK